MKTVLVHGFTGAPASFADVAPRHLPDADVFAPLLPGHGAAPARCASERFDDAVDELARAIPWTEPCALVGYSMGARVALRMLARHPHRFARAVLLGAHPGLESDGERAARRGWEQELEAMLTDRGLEPFVDAWESLPVLRPVRDVPPERLQRRRALRLRHTAGGLAHALRVLGLAAMPSTWPALPRITVPVTLVAGAGDPKFCALARAMGARLPAATILEIPACGHDIALEAPEELARILGGLPS